MTWSGAYTSVAVEARTAATLRLPTLCNNMSRTSAPVLRRWVSTTNYGAGSVIYQGSVVRGGNRPP